jgi:hypothetical protein
MDPPYALMADEATRKLVLAQAARTRALFAPSKGFLILRAPLDLVGDDRIIAGFEGPESHQYKDDMFVYIYMPDSTEESVDA